MSTTLDELRKLRELHNTTEENINTLMARARREGTPIATIADAAGIKSRNTVYLRTDPLMEKD